MISINKNSMTKVRDIIARSEVLGCAYSRLPNGTHVIDMGVNVPGSWEAAKLFTEIDMACLGSCSFRDFPLDDKISVTGVEVFVDNPELACMASQMAGLRLTEGEFSLIASGPARALARAEGDEHIKLTEYKDTHNEAVLGITSNELPDAALADKAAAVCGVEPDNLYLLMHSYNCLVNTVQVSARIVEQTINQMMLNAFDLSSLVTARGYCAVAPLAPDELQEMGWVNDCLLYGGKAVFWVRSTDEHIREKIPQLVTESAPDYGRLFIEMFEEAGRDFYAMDLSIHSPAMVQIVNLNTGHVFTAGSVRKDILMESFFHQYPKYPLRKAPRDRMISKQSVIEADLETVFGVITDLELFVQLEEGVKEVTITSRIKEGKGMTSHWVLEDQSTGENWELDEEILFSNRPHQYAYAGYAGGKDYSGVHTLTDLGNGTVLHEFNEIFYFDIDPIVYDKVVGGMVSNVKKEALRRMELQRGG